ncbi:hypothetical protein [Bacteroides finegoldii]|uniref:hypothetical protein n=1 Tax=Bacteroides finegoldii TaxID=338188 RepID=UPI0018A0C547|nr:hypothetical protein [Bacteroides finegoldii]
MNKIKLKLLELDVMITQLLKENQELKEKLYQYELNDELAKAIFERVRNDSTNKDCNK